MRCQFCGWDNPQGKDTCEKCNKPLAGMSSLKQFQENHSRPTDRQAGVANLKATVRENDPEARKADGNGKCPECGYQLENGKCPQCGYPSDNYFGANRGNDGNETRQDEKPFTSMIPERNNPRKTVRPQRKGEKEGAFKLVPISETDGKPEGAAIAYEGNEVNLNRENTDPKNQTITNQSQAVVRCKDGKWSIEDHSEYQTTFVQAASEIELHDGDLILLGNQLYRFDV